MIIALCLYDVRRMAPGVVCLVILVSACFLLTPGPLVAGFMTSILGGVVGLVIGKVLFADSSGTVAYVCSRGLSRRRLFGNRIVLGASLIAILAVVAWCLIASGLRSAVRHEARWSDWSLYPSIAGLESAAAVDVALKGIQVFGFMSFIMVLRALTASRSERSVGASVRPFVVAGVLIPVVLMFGLAGRFLMPGESGLITGFPDGTLRIYVAVASFLCVAAAWWHVRNVEVEA